MRDISEIKERIRRNTEKTIERAQKPEQKAKQTLYPDDKFWSYKIGADKVATARLRLLPCPKGEDVNVIEDIWYNWTNPANGKKYSAKCRDTLGKRDDPMTKYKNSLYATSYNLGKESGIRKKYRYSVNVYVEFDSSNPDNVGKVFIWNMPKTVYDIVMKALMVKSSASEFGEDEEIPDTIINPFDPFEGGASLLMKASIDKSGYVTYEGTRFGRKKPLFDDNQKIFEVLDKCYSLQELNDESNFETPEALQRKLDNVLSDGDDFEQHPVEHNAMPKITPRPPARNPVIADPAMLEDLSDFTDEPYEKSDIDKFNDELDGVDEPPKSVQWNDDDDFDFDAIKEAEDGTR